MIPLAPRSPSAGYTSVCELRELPVGSRRTFWLGPERVLLIRPDEQELHAIADRCPHALQPLADAEIADGSIRCSKHGACFDLRSGAPLNSVTPKSLKRFAVRTVADRVEIAPAENESNRGVQ